MKKLLLLLFAIATVIRIGYSQNSPSHLKNGWQMANLYGKVKSVTEFTYGAEKRFWKIKKIDDSGSRKKIYIYNVMGNLIEHYEYNADGSLLIKMINAYDVQGNRIEQYEYIADGSLSFKDINKYNDKGNQIEWSPADIDSSSSMLTHESIPLALRQS